MKIIFSKKDNPIQTWLILIAVRQILKTKESQLMLLIYPELKHTFLKSMTVSGSSD